MPKVFRQIKSTPIHDHSARTFEQAVAWCEQNEVALTEIRKLVLSLLYKAVTGVKAYDLLEQVKKTIPNAAPPTVYRALDFLIEKGLAHKVARLNLFVACSQETAHVLPSLFLICPSCNKVSEVQEAAMLKSLAHCVADAGHVFENPEVEISAVCLACHQAAQTQ